MKWVIFAVGAVCDRRSRTVVADRGSRTVVADRWYNEAFA